ncbi:immunoglobulin superfamily DCC subclass member 3-like isoform X1 [Gadus macrocephalus]|uniref:immunoglobulin superfamily DCC subclass member 3-like isoform X1 n=2 Tax=Gadus macrocephalus TaxID=80720 RepID=UPI0028CB1B00|nr:immunoglobulin superfamily DCC subclass member 3-like isoform X1 [Gadus macrocephalus]
MMRSLHLLSAFFILSVAGGASELAFLKEPSDVIAVRDRPLMLDCQVEGEGPISVTWRRNGVAVPVGARASVLANGTLLIEKFSKRRESDESDAGVYDCSAENRDGRIVSRKARVQLASLPKFLTHPESVAVDEGGVTRLTCQVNGIPEASITWEKNLSPLSTEDTRYTLLPHGVLQISGLRRGDGGSFRCVATNIANIRYSREALLTVTAAGSRTYKEPVILSGPQNLTITVHETAILECIATGNPRPIVSWSRLDGRSIGVEGIQVLGTGNLMISDASLQHSGVYVCSANRPGTRIRRTALGRLVVQAPPEFLQWPQSVSRPPGGSAVLTCSAQGVPEPHIIWLKNGKILSPGSGNNVKLTNNNTTLAITRITAEDEAIYQCIAENSAGTNQASARLALSPSSQLPEAPAHLQATPTSSTSVKLSWERPSPEVTEHIIGYVLHIRMLGEPDSKELQEAVSKTTFQHEFSSLEPATAYSIYLKAYSPLGASQSSSTLVTTTLGGVPASQTFLTKVLNRTAVQVFWELPSKPGKVEGFRLSHRRVPLPDFQALETLPAHINTHTYSGLEAAGVYEVRLVAYNGNGDGAATRRLVSLADPQPRPETTGCNCEDNHGSGLLIGVHISLACIVCCLLFLVFGYRHRKGTQDRWTLPRGPVGTRAPKDVASPGRPEAIELSIQGRDPTPAPATENPPPPCQVLVEAPPPCRSGTDTDQHTTSP